MERHYLPVLQMKDITAWGMDFLVRRRNDALIHRQISLVRSVQRKLHDNHIVVEINAVKLTVHVRKSRSVDVNDIAEVLSVRFLSCTDVIEVTPFSEERHELWCVFSRGFGRRVEFMNDCSVCLFFGCLRLIHWFSYEAFLARRI